MRSTGHAVLFLAVILLGLVAAELPLAGRHTPNAQHTAPVGEAQHVSANSILLAISRVDVQIRDLESSLRFALLFMHERFICVRIVFVLLEPLLLPCENRASSWREKVRMNTE